MHQGGFKQLPHAIDVSSQPGGFPGLTNPSEQGPELHVKEALLAFSWAGVALHPLLELIRRASSEKNLLPSMGLQACGPRQLDIQQPGLHFRRQPDLINPLGPNRGRGDAGRLRLPVGPTCTAKLADNAELLLFSIETAANAARAAAEGSQLLEGQPDRLAKLLRLPDRGTGDAVDRGKTVAASTAKADNGRRDSRAELAHERQLNLLPVTRPTQDRG